MKNKLIVLADKLDSINCKEAANFVDNLLKQAKEDNDEWVDEPTKVDRIPMPSSLPPLDPQALEPKELMTGIELVRDLRHIFSSLPNPDKWDDEVRGKISLLMDRLRDFL